MKSFLGVLALLSLVVACPLAAQPLDSGATGWLVGFTEALSYVVDTISDVVDSATDLFEEDVADSGGCSDDCSELGGFVDPEG